jgi:hypothetical protein
MGDSGIDADPANPSAEPHQPASGGQQTRQEWVRANFTEIFGVSAEELQGRGVNPRQYAGEHRQQIRQFAQMQRRQGLAVPTGGSGGNAGPSYGRGGRFGTGMRGGGAWIGILLILFALRFLLVDSFAGSHVAIFWVLGIGGIMLVVRVFLFSWLRNRRVRRRQSDGQPDGRSGF